MASTCNICGKRPEFGNSVSHSHLKTKHRWNPNIQRIKISLDGRVKRVNACVTCIKSDRVVKVSS